MIRTLERRPPDASGQLANLYPEVQNDSHILGSTGGQT
jgi:hypothetical protein